VKREDLNMLEVTKDEGGGGVGRIGWWQGCGCWNKRKEGGKRTESDALILFAETPGVTDECERVR